jgi:hypothetical protein
MRPFLWPSAYFPFARLRHFLEQFAGPAFGAQLDFRGILNEFAILDLPRILCIAAALSPISFTSSIGERGARYKSNNWFDRGTVERHALDVLGEADGPFGAREITKRMLADKGVADATTKQIRDLQARVLRSLRGYRARESRLWALRRRRNGCLGPSRLSPLRVEWRTCGSLPCARRHSILLQRDQTISQPSDPT